MNLTSIRKLFQNLYNKGFVPTLRKGPTGIGYTLEKELGLSENNVALPDFGSIELKSMRLGATRIITLFTLNRLAWSPSAKEAIKHYGYWDEERERHALYCAVKNDPNPQGLLLDVIEKQLLIKSIDGSVAAIWQLEAVRDKFIEKLQAMILVKAESKRIEGIEHFRYISADIMTGCNYRLFFEFLRTGKAFVDIRMHLKDTGAVRNDGTGFRIRSDLLEELYLDKIALIE